MGKNPITVSKGRFVGRLQRGSAIRRDFHALEVAPPDGRSGFTLIELLVVVTIIAILAALAMPAFTRTMESGRKTKCLSNLKQIGQAVLLYTADNSQLLPPFYNDTGMMMWYKEIRLFLGASKTGLPISAQYPQGRNLDVFYCPSVDRRRGYPHTDYGANTFVFNTDLAAGSQTRMPRIESPSKIVMFSEVLGSGIYPDSSWQMVAAAAMPNSDKCFPHRHGETVNLVFCDGHALGLSRSEAVANFTKNRPPWPTHPDAGNTSEPRGFPIPCISTTGSTIRMILATRCLWKS